MINDDALVELARTCARTCHMLKNVTQGRDADSLSGSSAKAIEDFGRYVSPAHSSLSMITNGIRTIRNIESVVSECRNNAHDLRGRHTGSTEEWLTAWRTKLWEILGILDVRDSHFAMSVFLNYLRGT